MNKMCLFLLSSVIVFAITTRTSADASPPLYPPGSAVLPPGETMVQMLSERVVINIVPSEERSEFGVTDTSYARVEAEFAMRNQGSATEHMDVRFPLTDPHGEPWGALEDFVAYVDGRSVPVHESEEPFTDRYATTSWAVFPVTFELGRDVLIKVFYSMDISGWGWGINAEDQDPLGGINPDTAAVNYTLETGAGWYGPIESGVIVLRLPYAASPANVFDLDTPLADYTLGNKGEHLSPPTFVGNEVRWEFTGLEPDWEDNLSIQFLWPSEWQRILSLEEAAERNPDDPTIAVKLAGAYLVAGSNTSGFASEQHCYLSQQAIYRGLVHHPTAPELLNGLKLVDSFCSEVFSAPPPATATETPEPTWTPRPRRTSSPTPQWTPSPTASLLRSTEEIIQSTDQGPSTKDVESPLVAVQTVIGFGLGFLLALGIAWFRKRPV